MLARGSFGFPHVSEDHHWGTESQSGSKDEDDMDDGPCMSEEAGGAKPKRKRPKFIRKVECQVIHSFYY
jgi:hypothetical protein